MREFVTLPAATVLSLPAYADGLAVAEAALDDAIAESARAKAFARVFRTKAAMAAALRAQDTLAAARAFRNEQAAEARGRLN